MKDRAIFERLSDVGGAAQATIPGLYAWAVTVAPAAWGRGAQVGAKLLALLGVALLFAAIFVERSRPRWAHALSVWGLVGTSALVWAFAPAALLPTHLDAPRGLAGMIGWALFAFASAAPAVPHEPAEGGAASRAVRGAPLRPRASVPRGDGWFIFAGTVLALALQVVGWRVVLPERALLVRLVALASGLAVIGAATQIALARHARRVPARRRVRVRRALAPVVGLIVLAVAGVALLLAGR